MPRSNPVPIYIKVIKGKLKGCRGYIQLAGKFRSACRVWDGNDFVSINLTNKEFDTIYPAEVKITKGKGD